MATKNKFEQYKSLFKSSISDKVMPETIPVGNLDTVNTLFEGMRPIEFVNEVMLGEDHKTDEGSGQIILTEEWAQSYAKAVNEKPGFLYIRGHADSEHWAMRAIADGYIVGAKVEDGRLLLRNRLLVRKDVAEQDLVEQTIRELKAGQLSTSTGDIQKHRVEINPETNVIQHFAIESIKNQTNAIVEHDMHASDAKVVGANFRIGSYNEKGNLIVTDGDDKNDKGVENMEFDEYVTGIKSCFASGKGDVSKLSTALGITVLTEEDKTVIAKYKALGTKIGGDVDTFVDSVIEERKANFATIRDAKLAEAFKEPIVLGLAKDFFSLKQGTTDEIEAEVTRLKSLASLISVQTEIASKLSYKSAGEEDKTGTEQLTGTVEA